VKSLFELDVCELLKEMMSHYSCSNDANDKVLRFFFVQRNFVQLPSSTIDIFVKIYILLNKAKVRLYKFRFPFHNCFRMYLTLQDSKICGFNVHEYYYRHLW
jgi:hypothetical protein